LGATISLVLSPCAHSWACRRGSARSFLCPCGSSPRRPCAGGGLSWADWPGSTGRSLGGHRPSPGATIGRRRARAPCATRCRATAASPSASAPGGTPWALSLPGRPALRSHPGGAAACALPEGCRVAAPPPCSGAPLGRCGADKASGTSDWAGLPGRRRRGGPESWPAVVDSGELPLLLAEHARPTAWRGRAFSHQFSTRRPAGSILGSLCLSPSRP